MTGKRVVVLGGGIGGVVAASEVRRRLGKEHRVVLVDKSGVHVFWPSLLWLQVGLRKPGRIVRDLALLERRGIEVIKAPVSRIEPDRKRVHVDGTVLDADYLVIALGAQLTPLEVPGLAGGALNLYSLDGATEIRQTRRTLREGKLVVLVAATPFKCPAAPYEAAMLLDHDLRKRKMRDRVEVSVYTPEAGPMGSAGPKVSAAVRQLLRARDISYYPNHQIASVEPGAKTLRFSNGASAGYSMLVCVPPHRAPQVVVEAGLTGPSGWVGVDRESMETPFPDVFAIGDVVGIPLTMGLPFPKAGVFAHRQAQAVARTIAARALGKGHEGVFDGRGECFIEVGGGKAGFAHGNFYGEPVPAIKLRRPSRFWHAAKVLFERRWLGRWF